MAAIKNILKHVRVEQAQRKRCCERNRANHPIKKGDYCLVVQNGQDAPNYCAQCATQILRLAQATLDDLKKTLDQ
jgi:hypothetical protein